MTMKRGWEKSTNGPDWMDVIGMMNALNVLHSGRVVVSESLVGTGFATCVTVKAAISFEILPGSQLPREVAVERVYPDRESTTFAGFVFRLLYELDYAISKVYTNERLWE